MAKYKVIVTARSFGKTDSKARELLEEDGCSVIKLEEAGGPIYEQLKNELPDADAVIAGLDDYDERLLARGGKLKVISRYGVGYDRVDVGAASKFGIKVTVTPGANGDSVADLADDDGYIDLSNLGNLIIKKQPDFDPRTYGFGKLSNMLKNLPRFEVQVRETSDPNVKPIYIRDQEAQ